MLDDKNYSECFKEQPYNPWNKPKTDPTLSAIQILNSVPQFFKPLPRAKHVLVFNENFCFVLVLIQTLVQNEDLMD